MQVESRLEGHLLDKPKQILVVDGGNNLCFIIDELSSGWRSKFAANFQVRNFLYIVYLSILLLNLYTIFLVSC